MDWTTAGVAASIVAAAAAVLGLAWRVVDKINARPQVTIEEAELGFSVVNQTKCVDPQLTFTIRNRSTAIDVLETLYVDIGQQCLRPVGWATRESPPCEIGAVPYKGSVSLTKMEIGVGETVRGRVVVQMQRAGRKEREVETSCRSQNQ